MLILWKAITSGFRAEDGKQSCIVQSVVPCLPVEALGLGAGLCSAAVTYSRAVNAPTPNG
jgi:hypothetical protein